MHRAVGSGEAKGADQIALSLTGGRLRPPHHYILVVVGSSGILKAKQKLGVTFNFDKQDVIDFMIFSKMTTYRASEANS